MLKDWDTLIDEENFYIDNGVLIVEDDKHREETWGNAFAGNFKIIDDITTIGGSAFHNCTSLKDVYYSGKQEDWNKITDGGSNFLLTNATKHYEYVVE